MVVTRHNFRREKLYPSYFFQKSAWPLPCAWERHWCKPIKHEQKGYVWTQRSEVALFGKSKPSGAHRTVIEVSRNPITLHASILKVIPRSPWFYLYIGRQRVFSRSDFKWNNSKIKRSYNPIWFPPGDLAKTAIISVTIIRGRFYAGPRNLPLDSLVVQDSKTRKILKTILNAHIATVTPKNLWGHRK